MVGSLDRRGDRKQSDRGFNLIMKRHACTIHSRTKAVAAGLDIPSEEKKGATDRSMWFTHTKSNGRDPERNEIKKGDVMIIC